MGRPDKLSMMDDMRDGWQMEEVTSHSFRASTIRDMELTLLKALQWRLSCVTPYSYLDLLPLPTTTAAANRSRCIRLLLRSLSGTLLPANRLINHSLKIF